MPLFFPQPFIFAMMLDGYDDPALSLSPLLTLFSLHWVKPLWRLGFWQWCVWCLRSDLTHSYTHTWIRRPFIDVSWWKSALTCAFGFMQCLSYVNHMATLVFFVDSWWISNYIDRPAAGIQLFACYDETILHLQKSNAAQLSKRF